MRRIAEKVVLVAHICITFVFALLTVLYVTKLVPLDEVADNNIVLILLIVLAVLYIVLSIYLLCVNFSEKVNVKRILLYFDAGGETRARASVVENIVRGCAKQVREVKVQKTKLRLDDKQGVIATIYVKASADNMTESLDRLRSLLVDNFKETLGLTFNSINFEVSKLNKKFVPNTKKAQGEKTQNAAPQQQADTTAQVEPVVEQPAPSFFEEQQPISDAQPVEIIEDMDDAVNAPDENK